MKMLIKRKETDGFILFNCKYFIYPIYFHFNLLNKIKISEIHYFFSYCPFELATFQVLSSYMIDTTVLDNTDIGSTKTGS